MDYRIFNKRMRSLCMCVDTGPQFMVSSEAFLWGTDSAQNFDCGETHPQHQSLTRHIHPHPCCGTLDCTYSHLLRVSALTVLYQLPFTKKQTSKNTATKITLRTQTMLNWVRERCGRHSSQWPWPWRFYCHETQSGWAEGRSAGHHQNMWCHRPPDMWTARVLLHSQEDCNKGLRT